MTRQYETKLSNVKPASEMVPLDTVIRAHVLSTLCALKWNRTYAARELGISIKCLRDMLSRWGLLIVIPNNYGRPVKPRKIISITCNYCGTSNPDTDKHYRKFVRDTKIMYFFCCIEHRESWLFEHRIELQSHKRGREYSSGE